MRPVDDGTGAPGVAVSSDGRRVVFVGATSSGARRLFVYDVASSEVTEVADTDDAASPFWAPDGTRIGFFAHGHLVIADLVAHRASVLADAPSGR